MNEATIKSLKNEMTEMNDENEKHKILLALDFDGTVVEHDYPYIGKENENCIDILKKWIKDYNVEIVLDTMRGGKLRDDALKWFSERGIEIKYVGKYPSQFEWTDSNKAYALFSIDDRNVGCPLKFGANQRCVVDWNKVKEIFEPILIKLNS